MMLTDIYDQVMADVFFRPLDQRVVDYTLKSLEAGFRSAALMGVVPDVDWSFNVCIRKEDTTLVVDPLPEVLRYHELDLEEGPNGESILINVATHARVSDEDYLHALARAAVLALTGDPDWQAAS